MRRRRPRAVSGLVGLAIAFGATGMGSNALADQVPNEQNWHIHDGTGAGPLAGDHHAGLGFWPRLFSQEGLLYGTAAAPYVMCPNATDKVFLPNGVHGAVDGSGVCMSDRFIVHILSGVEPPAGWSTLSFPNGTFLSYPGDMAVLICPGSCAGAIAFKRTSRDFRAEGKRTMGTLGLDRMSPEQLAAV